MAPSTSNHDPASTHQANAGQQSPSGASGGVPTSLSPNDIPNVQLAGLDQNQIMSLLRHLPHVFTKLTEQGNPKEDAAQTLSNLATQSAFPIHQLSPQQGQHPYPGGPNGVGGLGIGGPGGSGLPGINDPGPSSHPRGPPNLGQLSAVAMQAAPVSVGGGPTTRQQMQQQQSGQMSVGLPGQGQEMEEGASEDDGNGGKDQGQQQQSGGSGSTGRTRGGRSATMGSDEWSRQRKDNHKEVERRRRGNINEGINELGRIVPNGSGEKAKGAILSRAVQYIHHLKENEARNIEKWTLEKLLMDQAMGDLQAQLDECRRLWEEERMARARAEGEVEVLRGVQAQQQAQQQQQQQQAQAQQQAQQQQQQAQAKQEAGDTASTTNSTNKRRSVDGPAGDTSPDAQGGEQQQERDGKRQRTE